MSLPTIPLPTEPLPENIWHALTHVIMDGAAENFMNSGNLMACIFPFDKEGVPNVIGVPEMSPQVRRAVEVLLERLTAQHTYVAMVSEIWFTKVPRSRFPGQSLEEIRENVLPPSLDPQRIERIACQLWQGKKSQIWMVDILRDPNDLEHPKLADQWEFMKFDQRVGFPTERET